MRTVARIGWLSVFLFAGCGLFGGSEKSVAMATNTQLAPAAQGTVKAKAGENQNTQIAIEVKHLAEPYRVQPRARVYVAWINPQGQEAQPRNVGALRVDKNLTGKLQTVTPYTNFDVTVTAEESPTASSPSGPPVLRTTVSAQ